MSLPNLPLASLYRTGLAPTDLLFLSSCINRDDYLKQKGKQAADDDPTKPYQYFWDEKAASLPPDQLVDVLMFNGSPTEPALVSATMRAGDLAEPNLPGDETFPLYVVPFTNATWVQTPGFPPNTFPSSWLSQEVDARALIGMFPGATLQPGQDALPQAVFTLGNTPAGWQPWVMIIPDGTKTFAGGLIEQMYGPNQVNGGGVGNSGKWVGTGWVPDPHPSGQSVSTLGSPCTPVPDGYQLEGVENGITFIPMLVPIVTAGVAKLVVSVPLGIGTYHVVMEGAGSKKAKAVIGGKIAANCPNCGKPRSSAHAGGVLVATDTSQCTACGTQF